jgi:hypothetical protein
MVVPIKHVLARPFFFFFLKKNKTKNANRLFIYFYVDHKCKPDAELVVSG